MRISQRPIALPQRMCVLTLALALAVLRLDAQPSSFPGREPVMVALLDGTQGIATAEIVRARRGLPNDVIVLTDGKRAGRTLASAIFSLLVAREVQGDTAARTASVRVPQGMVPQTWLDNGEMARAIATVERLRTMPPRTLPQVGQARVLTIHLPKGALRGRLTNSAGQ